jgi:hypothetical protein
MEMPRKNQNRIVLKSDSISKQKLPIPLKPQPEILTKNQ